MATAGLDPRKGRAWDSGGRAEDWGERIPRRNGKREGTIRGMAGGEAQDRFDLCTRCIRTRAGRTAYARRDGLAAAEGRSLPDGGRGTAVSRGGGTCGAKDAPPPPPPVRGPGSRFGGKLSARNDRARDPGE